MPSGKDPQTVREIYTNLIAGRTLGVGSEVAGEIEILKNKITGFIDKKPLHEDVVNNFVEVYMLVSSYRIEEAIDKSHTYKARTLHLNPDRLRTLKDALAAGGYVWIPLAFGEIASDCEYLLKQYPVLKSS